MMVEKVVPMNPTANRDRTVASDDNNAESDVENTDTLDDLDRDAAYPDTYSEQLELALRGMLEVTVAVLERMDKKVGLASLRALQSLRRQGPCMVTELAHDCDMLASTASRLSDRLAEAELITRRVSPINRRATQLELAPAGQAALDELVAVRAAALAEITHHMSPEDRHALLIGAQAFTRARATRAHDPHRASHATEASQQEVEDG
jgi:DNA-binding MarR family transcriptional regulator